MLAGQDFGGDHQGGLVAMGHGKEHGVEGDDGFAGSHIPLDQAIHGEWLSHVMADIIDGAALIVGEGEWEAAEDAGVDQGRGWNGGGWGGMLPTVSAHGQGELVDEEFLKDEAVAGVIGFFQVFGLMDLAKGGLDWEQVVGCAKVVGEHVLDEIEQFRDRGIEHGDEVFVLEAFGEPINGEGLADRDILMGIEDDDGWVSHFPRDAGGFGNTGCDKPHAAGVAIEEEGLVVPDESYEASGTTEEDAKHGTALGQGAKFDRLDGSVDGSAGIGLKFIHAAERGGILIGFRKIEEEIEGAMDAESFEQEGPFWADRRKVRKWATGPSLA